MRFTAVLLAALALVPLAQAGTTPTAPVYDGDGNLVQTPFAAPPSKARLSVAEATRTFLADDKVADWLKRYPPRPTTDATYKDGVWTVNVWSGKAGEIATGKVDDTQGFVTEAWTGPQVAWKMARGTKGAFGGTRINSYPVWLGLCALFLLGLADWRRLLSMRNLDLLVLVSFSVSLWFFNRGNVFAAMPLAYPPLLYCLGRCVWIARRDTPSRGAPTWPAWILLGATVFLVGFRIGLNVRASNVIDVGFAGVVGADRISHGEAPYGHMPVEDPRPKCGPADAEGEVRERVQTNGRCEAAIPQGDTYGPVSYLAYLPGYWVFGWTGKWDRLRAAHATSIIWDLVALIGMFVLGWRFGGEQLASTLAFAWAAWPFTQYVSNSNTNDSIMPAILIWGLVFAMTHWARGAFLALGAWTKFAALLLVPLWSGYPEARRPRPAAVFAAGFLGATALAFWVLLLEPNPVHAARVFYDRTFDYQIGRASPFSIWDWGQYHARGLPDLHLVQRLLEVLLLVGVLALAWFPRHRSPLRFAALTAAVLIGFELVLTHWFYLYLPWFFPFVAFALLVSAPVPAPEPVPARNERKRRALVAG